MEIKNWINYLKFGLFITLTIGMISCKRCQNVSDSENLDMNLWVVSDSTLQYAIDTFVVINGLEKGDALLRLFIENIPEKKSFIICNSYSADDLKVKNWSFYSKYNGFDMIIYTGLEKFEKNNDSIPEALKRFLNKEPKIFNYISYRFEYDKRKKIDTFYRIAVNDYLFDK